MSDISKPKRLVAVAKELNVGTATIVDHLADQGYDVENKPTTKLSSEMYSVLLKEFQSEKAMKEKADQIHLGGAGREEVSIVKGDADKSSRDDEDSGEELIVKNLSSSSGISNPEEDQEVKEKAPGKKEKINEEGPEKEEKKAEKEVVGPKVVGKIDLQTSKPRTKKEKEEAFKKEKEDQKKQEAKKKEEDKLKSEEDAAAKKVKDVQDKAQKKKEEDEASRIHTKFEKLHGPKILGKIELKEEEKKKKPTPVASSSDSKPTESTKKRKRKRISKGGDGPGKGHHVPKGKPRGKQIEEKQEVSEKEIQDKIKATMAKLDAGKSKSRQKLRRAKRDDKAELFLEQQEGLEENVIQVTEFISVAELANMLGVSAPEVISTCMSLGIIVSINQRIDAEIIELVSEEFGYKAEFISFTEQEEEVVEEDDPATRVDRPPIVTIMGHVDHGKTSLLDYIRKANVIAGEAGGITQHIGAYAVELPDKRKITFLDTPGHEAFTAMRARGAKLTDVAVIVVSADDQVMPQTKEAISHAQAANVPMIFAINKIDKEGADPEKIKGQLAEMNLLVEDWGGKFQSQDISAKMGNKVEELMEKILLEAELLELKANPDKLALGTVVEASLDKGKGYVATVLVQEGTLKVGDVLLAGSTFGKVKAMMDERGNRVTTAGPSTPVQILGLNGAPAAGEKIRAYVAESEVKNLANKRSQIEREQGMRAQKHITLDEIGRRLAVGDFQELNVIVKGDVDGSIEALADSLQKLSTDEIHVNIIHKAVGAITESDVMLASASDAIIVGFQVRPSLSARKLAENESIEIRLYSIIYDAIDEIKSAMEGMLKPKIEEKILGNAEIRETFKISKVGTVAGCYVTDGKILRNAKIRLVRNGIVTFSGELASLKRFSDDAKEVKNGFECGLNLAGYNDIKVGDVIEAYEEVEVKRTLS